jgi:hypothetical protein
LVEYHSNASYSASLVREVPRVHPSVLIESNSLFDL